MAARILNLPVRETGWSAYGSDRSTTIETSPGTDCIKLRRLGGAQALSGRGGEMEGLCPCQEPNASSPTTALTQAHVITALTQTQIFSTRLESE
jgi:hypothetical protein